MVYSATHSCTVCGNHREDSFDNYYYKRKQLLLSARLSHRNSVRPSVCLSVRLLDCHTGGLVKSGKARITKSSPSAA